MQKASEGVGFRILRFQDEEVHKDMENVIRELEYELEKSRMELNLPPPNSRQRGKKPSPGLLSEGEESHCPVLYKSC